MAKKWEQVEDYLDTYGLSGGTFSSAEYSAAWGVSRSAASHHIQAYVAAQRAPKSRTKYVLQRVVGTRTSTSRWSVGEKTKDMRRLGLGFSNDVKTKWIRAVEPDIRRIAAINPAAAHRAEVIIEATCEGALKVLAAAVRT